MIFFSEILNKKVYSDKNRYLGKISDLLIHVKDKPYITKFILKKKSPIVVSINYLFLVDGKLQVKSDYQHSQKEEFELSLKKNILDKQIIDIEGSKVVRVNDILLQEGKDWYMAGVDTSMRIILRWFGMAWLIPSINKIFPYHKEGKILAWGDIQLLELSRGQLKLKLEQDRLQRLRPEDLADYLEKTDISNTRKILLNIDEQYAADVVNNLNITFQSELIRDLKPEKAARILSMSDPDEVVDILIALPKVHRETIINLMDKERKAEIVHLLSHAKTPIGKLMTTEYFTASPNETIQSVVDRIRNETSQFEQLYYVYVINERKELIGVCNFHELLLHKSDTPLYRFMITNLLVLHLSTPEDIAINRMLKYKLSALPVVNTSRKLLGIITLDDIAEYIVEKLR